MPRRTWRTTIAGLVATVATLVAVGCGGQEAQVVQTAFDHPIERATMEMGLQAQTPGGAFTVNVNGPFSSNGSDQLPDADLKISAQGPGMPGIEAEIITTNDNAFVVYDGVTYEVGKDKIAQLEAEGAKKGSQSPADIQAMLQKMKDWFPDTSTQTDAELDGEKVTRVNGRMDLSKALQGFMDIAKQSGAADPQAAKALQSAPLGQIEKFLSDPRFTLDVAKSDGTLRRLAAETELQGVPGGGKIAFSVQFRDVGKPVTVTPPSSGRPIEELGQKLGGLAGAVPGATS
jgi:hypothetical protein